MEAAVKHAQCSDFVEDVQMERTLWRTDITPSEALAFFDCARLKAAE